MQKWIKRKQAERRGAIWYAALMRRYVIEKNGQQLIPCNGTFKQLTRKNKLLKLQAIIDLKHLSCGTCTYKMDHYWQQLLLQEA